MDVEFMEFKGISRISDHSYSVKTEKNELIRY
jgi:hypothetical protein